MAENIQLSALKQCATKDGADKQALKWVEQAYRQGLQNGYQTRQREIETAFQSIIPFATETKQ